MFEVRTIWFFNKTLQLKAVCVCSNQDPLYKERKAGSTLYKWTSLHHAECHEIGKSLQQQRQTTLNSTIKPLVDCCAPGYNQGTSSKISDSMSKSHKPRWIIPFYLVKWLAWKISRHFSSQIKVIDKIQNIRAHNLMFGNNFMWRKSPITGPEACAKIQIWKMPE